MTGEPILRIRIHDDIRSLQLNSAYRSETVEIPTGRFNLKMSGSDIKLSDGTTSIHFRPFDIFQPVESAGTMDVPDTLVGDGFHWSHSEDLTYPGGFTFSVTRGKIELLNIVSLEEYLTSVISSEMSSSAPSPFLKAHAVVSRSWVLAQVEMGRYAPVRNSESDYDIWEWHDREDHDGFHLCNDDHCQRYHGLSRPISPEATRAVSETRGTILSANDTVVDARFSKCCGGISERFSTAWQDIEPPGITSILDAATHIPGFAYPFESGKDAERWIMNEPAVFCNPSIDVWDRITVDMDKKTTGYFRWNVTYEQDELAALVEKKTSANLGLIRSIDILRRGPSGRALVVRIHGAGDSISIGKELTIRRILSPTHLKSSAIVIKPGILSHGIPDSFTIYGAGWGHGVGMCQIGAGAMAMQGYDFRSILAHYFPTAKLITLY